MIDEMRAECVELSITACEKFAANYEVRRLLGQNIGKLTLILEFVFYLLDGTDGREINQRGNGQKIWHLLACDRWRGFRLRSVL